MDILEFGCVMTLILVSGLLVFVKISATNAIKMQEFADKARLAKIRQDSAMARYRKDDQEPELGAWVTELAQSAGFDVEKLFSDEMPPEVAKLLPIAKGFLEGGGLKKLLGGTGEAPDELRKAI